MTLPKQSATLDGKALAQDYQGNNACISPSSLALLTDLTHLTRKILLQQKFGKKKYIWQKYVKNKKRSGKHVSNVSNVRIFTCVGLSNTCYCEHKAKVMTSRGDFHPRGLVRKLLYLR